MQFNKNGPDIPSRLLQAHEDGRVVFFCGAGVSYPAGLPGFGDLVAGIFAELGEIPNQIEAAALAAKQYDTAVGLMERRFGRLQVRQKLAAILSSGSDDGNAISTHRAMLDLSRLSDGRTRLITTNFDRLFETVIATDGRQMPTHCAPYLPVPKNRWTGLVYLHGLLPSDLENQSLDHLVVSSGDFGLAYLAERWASRFVSELFRNYVVCFVGYSLNDPVLRYMTDALAADKVLGESTLEMFAFASYAKGKEEEVSNEWRAKNVTPVLYLSTPKHTYLHRALHEWAHVYRSGASAKEAIVTRYASASPLGTTQQDDFVRRMMWALCDKSGTPARKFAQLDPVPSLDWLTPLTNAEYRHADLAQFGVAAGPQDDTLEYSILERPTPYDLAPKMSVTAGWLPGDGWDEVMLQLAVWLSRHLDKPALLLWVVGRGGRIHSGFSRLIERALDRGDLPAPMPALWRLALSNRIRRQHPLHAYAWVDRFRKFGLTATSRFDLRHILTPHLQIFASAPQREMMELDPESDRTVRWELVLGAEDVRSAMEDLRDEASWQAVLPSLLDEFTQLLKDAQDMRSDLGEIDSEHDYSYIAQPSISPHPQNQGFNEWTILVELVRDAWEATARNNPQLAHAAARRFMSIDYPLFKRLAFHAASQALEDVDEAIAWLGTADGRWLWSPETARESLRLIAAIGHGASADQWIILERQILEGLPETMLSGDIEPDRLARIKSREIWLRLATAVAAGAKLTRAGDEALGGLAQANPEWRLSDDQREEFPVWSGDDEEWRIFVTVPNDLPTLVAYLQANPTPEFPKDDDWRQRCEADVTLCLDALSTLSNRQVWIASRWITALQAWGTETIAATTWENVAAQILFAPDVFLAQVAGPLMWWLQAVIRATSVDETLLFACLQRVAAALEDAVWEPRDDTVFAAINHPLGRVVEVALSWWFKQSLKDDLELPALLKELLDLIVALGVPRSMPALLVLASHVVTLYRVDKPWTTANILPAFDWKQGEAVAKPVWEGYLRAPRVYYPLFEAMRKPFLATASAYDILGKYGPQYASVLAYVALERRPAFSLDELRKATRQLPVSGLERTAQTLVDAIESSGEKRGDYWRDVIKPYIGGLWPKDAAFGTEKISRYFAELCIATGVEFPDALKTLRRWLLPVGNWAWVLKKAIAAGNINKFPREYLELVASIVRAADPMGRDVLPDFLAALLQAVPALRDAPDYRRLARLAKQE
ncbi:anti-phage defense-associated sirtuin Dsr1 [Cupriavidus taiwanensis]|uniref:SIR2-like domain-containing protein n=1 Tax=Cupriavidus taiwanensis TaxID=164546 RepID=A0A7Z7JHG8_9BURK|nr:anti-phage defense-associated sirtuin Dsr1 [Cupriavidus taiwanensis]SOZ17278.1 conserved hypothetical protein [Cupriavidus taiwanensis]SOZ96396.1 conserved hypothetical protein [Cupriavidus taiwanensis]SPC25658.1 conserved hypothetical protein [Cupriavidus taiwanensis]